jgi:hypothetical protein
MDKFSEELFELIARCRSAEGKGSRAAAVVGKECQMIVSNNPNRARSKAASVPGINKVKAIHDFMVSNGRL